MTDDKPSAKNLEMVVCMDKDAIADSKNPEFIKLIQSRLKHANETLANDTMRIALSDGTSSLDENYCGIFGAETGKRDPFHWVCSTLHDPRYQALLDGKDPGRTNVQTQWDFTKGILSTMAEGLYAVVTGPFYILFGAVLGGSLRFTQLQRRAAAKEGKPWTDNEPED